MGDQGDSYTASIDGSRHDEDEITSRGDLTLVIGKEKVRLRVHSAVMRDGSPVFDEWLGCTPGWGPMILKENPRELSLEDDDPEAIRLLCSILHCTITASPPAPTSILRLAEAALRYDAVSKVCLTVRVWYNKLASSQEEVDELWPLLLAADILHLDDFFADVSLQLLLKHSGSFQNLTRRGELGNAATCLALEEARSDVRVLIMDTISWSNEEARARICPVKFHRQSINVFLDEFSDTMRSLPGNGYVTTNIEIDKILMETPGLCLVCFRQHKTAIGLCIHRVSENEELGEEDNGWGNLQGEELWGIQGEELDENESGWDSAQGKELDEEDDGWGSAHGEEELDEEESGWDCVGLYGW